MAKAEWGSKRACSGCGARFYDLRREPIICPVCGSVHDPERQPKPRRPGPGIKDEPVPAARVPAAAAASDALDEEVVEAEGGDLEELEDTEAGDAGDDELATENGDLMEDTSELGEDDDDIGEVMEHVDDETEDKP